MSDLIKVTALRPHWNEYGDAQEKQVGDTYFVPASALDALAGLADTHGLPAKDGAEGAAEPAPKAGKAK